MKFKKIFAYLLGFSMLISSENALADELENVVDTSQTQQFEQTNSNGYVYTSKRYQYRILCPTVPQVIPVSMMYEGQHGDILIFDYENDDVMQIKTAWVVIVDAFDSSQVIDFNSASQDEFEIYLEQLKNANAFSAAVKLQLPNENSGVLAVTAKTLDIDEDGDGEIDATATADHQEIVVYFRTKNGNRPISIQLLAYPEVSKDTFEKFKIGVATFEAVS